MTASSTRKSTMLMIESSDDVPIESKALPKKVPTVVLTVPEYSRSADPNEASVISMALKKGTRTSSRLVCSTS